MQNKLEEDKQISAKDIKTKIHKLDMFIRKLESRIASQEKKIVLLQQKKDKDGIPAKRKVLV